MNVWFVCAHFSIIDCPFYYAFYYRVLIYYGFLNVIGCISHFKHIKAAHHTLHFMFGDIFLASIYPMILPLPLWHVIQGINLTLCFSILS